MNDPRSHLYILDGKTPVPVTDALVWGQWYETADRIVKSDMIQGVHVSTVFLGLDRGYAWMTGHPGYKPLLFETMVFGGLLDGHQQRYSTWVGAEYGHQKVVEKVRAAI